MDANQIETAASVVHGLCSEVERISGQLQEARAWAALWKRAAKNCRKEALWWQEQAWIELARRIHLEVEAALEDSHE